MKYVTRIPGQENLSTIGVFKNKKEAVTYSRNWGYEEIEIIPLGKPVRIKLEKKNGSRT